MQETRSPSTVSSESNTLLTSMPNSPISSNTSSRSQSLSEEETAKKFRSLHDIYETTQAMYVADPLSYEEASEKIECNSWCNEIEAIERNDTWELVDLPKDKKAIGVKWVFKTKFKADGSIQKYKARLVQ